MIISGTEKISKLWSMEHVMSYKLPREMMGLPPSSEQLDSILIYPHIVSFATVGDY